MFLKVSARTSPPPFFNFFVSIFVFVTGIGPMKPISSQPKAQERYPEQQTESWVESDNDGEKDPMTKAHCSETACLSYPRGRKAPLPPKGVSLFYGVGVPLPVAPFFWGGGGVYLFPSSHCLTVLLLGYLFSPKWFGAARPRIQIQPGPKQWNQDPPLWAGRVFFL